MPLIFFGDDRLTRKSEEVGIEYIQSQEFSDVTNEMLAIHKKTGAVGIAAPQIGINKAIILIGIAENSSRKINFDFPVQVLVNPRIKPINDEIVEADEGCLSLPGIMASIPRYNAISVNALDKLGSPVSFEATGIIARVVQHEIDHLHGINFISLVKNFSTLKFFKEMTEKVCSL